MSSAFHFFKEGNTTMAEHTIASGMRDVDRAADPEFFVRYLDTASGLVQTQQFKQRTFALLNVQAGMQLLDVGCGTGDDVRALAQLVGGTGRVVGVDKSETMVAEAHKRSEGEDLPVEYYVSDAQRLPFAAQTFDGCRAERLFQHVEFPRQVLAEMVRVTRPGGRIVVLDPDFGTLALSSQDRAATRELLHFACDSRIRNGWIGRQLPALLTTNTWRTSRRNSFRRSR
jgi:ubiquinone/menaquinone biosynthesis C-methylase UbiE